MESEPPPIENPPPSRSGAIWFLPLVLAPLPMGVLAGPLRLFNIALAHKSVDSSPLTVFFVFTLFCCVGGGIGMCGFKKGIWMGLIGGTLAGLVFSAIEISIILFAGLCIGLNRIH